MTSNGERIAVVGVGYVGATTAACMAELGHDVGVFDIDPAKVDAIASGRAPIFEAGLDELVARHTTSRRLRASMDLNEIVSSAAFVFLCVPTPSGPDGSADLTYLEEASRMVGPLLMPGAVVINKSTVPVGSTQVVASQLNRDDVEVASNPEFLREGTAVRDFMAPDRVVIGSDRAEVATRVAALYESLGDIDFVHTDPASAELIKYASNAYLATRLSFINAVAEVCEALGGDISEVARGIGLDSRIGPEFLNPGPGWGGSCFPKDTRAMVAMADQAGFDFRFLRGVIESNEQQFELIAQRALEMAGVAPTDARIAVLGLAFKAGTDDVRNSPAVEIANRLVAAGATVTAHDPQSSAAVSGVVQFGSAINAAAHAHLLLVLTEWPEYSDLDPEALGAVMTNRAVLDTRDVIDARGFAAHGFAVRQVGRGLRTNPTT